MLNEQCVSTLMSCSTIIFFSLSPHPLMFFGGHDVLLPVIKNTNKVNFPAMTHMSPEQTGSQRGTALRWLMTYSVIRTLIERKDG